MRIPTSRISFSTPMIVYQMALLAELAKLESRAKRGASRKIPMHERLADDRHRRFRTTVGCLEEASFPELRSDGSEVIAAHGSYESDLFGYVSVRLAGKLIKT
jgi:hypothetical protein